MDVEEFLKTKQNIDTQEITYPIKRIKTYESYAVVYLDEEKIMVSDDAYFQYKLHFLKGLDEKLYQILKDEERLFKAYRGCLRKISTKDQTVRQIKRYLFEKGLKGKECDDIVDKLISYGLLDDEKYAISRVSALQNANLSAKQIRRKLSDEGIGETIINECLITNEKKEYEKALACAQKYERTVRNRTLRMKKQAILTKLVGQGFSYELSFKAVEELRLKEENEVELLNKEYLKAKKRYEKKYEDYELKSHITSYLLSKGFDYDAIRMIMEENNGEKG